jgi:hypothetical protein
VILLVLRIRLGRNNDRLPFLHGRLECIDFAGYVTFYFNRDINESYVTSQLFTSTMPREITEAKLSFRESQPGSTQADYEIFFERLRVVQYSEHPSPCTLGKDFLSICPIEEKNGQFELEAPDSKIRIKARSARDS